MRTMGVMTIIGVGIVLMTLSGAGCTRLMPGQQAETRTLQPMQEEEVTAPVDLSREPILFRFGHRYGHEIKDKRLDEHQIVHEMRELLDGVSPDDLELFRRGFRLGYGRGGFAIFDRLWEEAQTSQ